MNSTTRYKSTNPNACLKSQNNAIHPHTPSSSSLIPTLSLFPASQPSKKPSQTIRFFQSKPALRIPCFQHHTSGYPCSLLSPTHCQDHEKNTEHGTLTHVQKLQHLLKRYSRDHPWLTEFSRFPLQPLLQTFQLMSYWVTFHYSATCTPFLWHSHLASDLTSVSIQPPPQSQRSHRPGKPSPQTPSGLESAHQCPGATSRIPHKVKQAVCCSGHHPQLSYLCEHHFLLSPDPSIPLHRALVPSTPSSV